MEALAEVVQSLLLLAILWWSGRRWVSKRLRDRQARIASSLSEAGQAERDAVRIREEASVLPEAAAREAEEILRAARAQAEQEHDAAMARLETEAIELVEQARQSVEQEKARVLRESSDRLVRLTTEAARRYVDEMLTEGDRRALVQKAILASLEVMEGKPSEVS